MKEKVDRQKVKSMSGRKMPEQAMLARDAETETDVKCEGEADAPDVFVLPPLFRKQATAKVVMMGPALFSYVPDEDTRVAEGSNKNDSHA